MLRCLISYAFVIITISSSFGQHWEWVRTGTSTSCARGDGITADNFGNIYTVGGYQNAIKFNTTSLLNYGLLYDDIFIVKHNASGDLLWAKKAGSQSGDYGTEIKYRDGFIYLIGEIGESGKIDNIPMSEIPGEGFFFAKFTLDGSIVWVQQFGGDSSSVIPVDFYFSDSGDVAITGFYWNKFSTPNETFYSNGGTDFFLMLVDSLGNIKWAHCSGGFFDDFLRGVCTDQAGNVYAVGYFIYDIVLDSTLLQSDNQAILTVKFNNQGNLEWAEVIDGSWNNEGRAITILNEKIYIGGCAAYTAFFDSIEVSFGNQQGAFIAEYNPDGSCDWVKVIQSGYHDNIYSLDPSADNDIIFCGVFGDTLTIGSDTLITFGNQDILIGKPDNDGNPIWTMTAGSGLGDNAFDLCGDELNNFYVTGDFYDQAHFGDIEVSFKEECSDAFIAKINAVQVSIEEALVEESLLSIFPNPAAQSITIEVNNPGKLTIVNLLGETTVINRSIFKGKSIIDISHLLPGIYVLVFSTLNGYNIEKLVVQ